MSLPPPPLARRRLLLQRMAWVCAVMVLAITSLSAFLRLSKYGLDCDPWPQCYAQAQQDSAAGPAVNQPSGAEAAARLAHRVIASAALLLVLVMLMTALASRPTLWPEGRLTLGLLALALFLAVLGRWTAQSQLPAVTLGNLLGGFAMLALSLRLASGRPVGAQAGTRAWLWAVFVLMLLETALGGLASASGSLLACDGTGDCWAKAQGSPAWSALNPWHTPVPGGSAGVHWTHRLGGWAVLLLAAPLLSSMFAAAARRAAAASRYDRAP